MRGRPKGIPDSCSRSKVNYKGGAKGRKDKKLRDNSGYCRRWELFRIRKEAEKYGVSLIDVDEAEIRRRYLLWQYCCNIGKGGRRFRSNQVKRLSYKQLGLLPFKEDTIK